MENIARLEEKLIHEPEFDPLMILEYHLQLAAVAVVASSEYNEEVVALMFNGACEQLKLLCLEEMQNKPVNLIIGGSNTVN